MDFKVNSLKEAAEILNKEGVKFNRIFGHEDSVFIYFLKEKDYQVAMWCEEESILNIEPIPIRWNKRLSRINIFSKMKE